MKKDEAHAGDALAIAGFVPLSTVDWPGRLAATVFLQGCPWRCPYCQNHEILDPRAPGRVPWDHVRAFLRRRRGLLDAVVFSGGEATRQAGLAAAMAEARELGFEVGLHTGGAYPRRFAGLLPLVDWVGLDIKALPGDYRAAAGADAGAKAWECLDLLLAEADRRGGRAGENARDAHENAGENACVVGLRPLGYEIRTTVHPGSPAAESLGGLVEELRARGVERFALQEARMAGTDEVFRAMARRWDGASWRRRWGELCAVARDAGFASVEIRGA